MLLTQQPMHGRVGVNRRHFTDKRQLGKLPTLPTKTLTSKLWQTCQVSWWTLLCCLLLKADLSFAQKSCLFIKSVLPLKSKLVPFLLLVENRCWRFVFKFFGFQSLGAVFGFKLYYTTIQQICGTESEVSAKLMGNGSHDISQTLRIPQLALSDFTLALLSPKC